jgi:hypothetical protein
MERTDDESREVWFRRGVVQLMIIPLHGRTIILIYCIESLKHCFIFLEKMQREYEALTVCLIRSYTILTNGIII